jgi:O-antigen/teichoic acid export membrane protein
MPRFFRHISASTLQFGLNQALGLLLFYLLSRGLQPGAFGELNWSLAVCLTAFTLLGLGLDALVVKRIAAGEPPGPLLSVYHAHVRWTGAGAYLVLLALWGIFPAFFAHHLFLLGIALAKMILFWALPYKQLAAGKERFGILMKMAICSSAVKTGAVLLCWWLDAWSAPLLIGIFITGDAAEWLLSRYLGRRLEEPRTRAPHAPEATAPRLSLQAWLLLLKTSLPQAGVVLFSSAIARFDWIFIGLFVSATKLAEYSFAYKAFEVSSLPLLAIAPLLVPLFTRSVKDRGRTPDLGRLLRAEMVIAWGTVLVLNLAWPLVDPLTLGRYGAVNARTLFLLSLCLPITYLNNLLWTIHFAHGRLRWIFRAFAIGFILNVTGDVVLIPLYGNEGAALAFLGAMLIQTLLYHRGIRELSAGEAWLSQTLCAVCAGAAALGAFYLASVRWERVCCGGGLYLLALLLTGRIRLKDVRYLRRQFS